MDIPEVPNVLKTSYIGSMFNVCVCFPLWARQDGLLDLGTRILKGSKNLETGKLGQNLLKNCIVLNFQVHYSILFLYL